jgi:predicted RNase H-like nuclease (RuvC/YqgF family)
MLKIPYLLSRRTFDELQREIERLRTAHERMREKVEEAQQAMTTALNQAEEQRRGKERIRLKNAALKKSLGQARRVTEQLEKRVATLLAANAELGDRDRSP